MARIPAAEVDVTPRLVRALLAGQHPDLLQGRAIAPFANGWDNAMLRLGDDLLVRLPRRELAAELVEHEQAWLPRLVDRVPAPIPAPLRTGRAAAGYPWSWSVLPWLPGHALGSPAPAVELSGERVVAAELGRFLAALHTPAPDDVWSSPYRGGALGERTAVVAERAHRYAGPAAGALLERFAVEVASHDRVAPRLWVHGDMHPLNVLVEQDRLAAVIDWGDLTAGDPACDLAIAWLGFDAVDGAALRRSYDDAVTHPLDLGLLWARAHAWALHLSLVIVDGSDDHPELAAVGRHGLRRLTDDA